MNVHLIVVLAAGSAGFVAAGIATFVMRVRSRYRRSRGPMRSPGPMPDQEVRVLMDAGMSSVSVRSLGSEPEQEVRVLIDAGETQVVLTEHGYISKSSRPHPTSRFANVFIHEISGNRLLKGSDAVSPDDVVSLKVGIGPLDADSLVRSPEPFPQDVLPREDVWLRVLVASPDFAVGRTRDLDPESRACEQPLLLPMDGSPSRTEKGESLLSFFLRAPHDSGVAEARICYYYRDSLVQSQVLVTQVGSGQNNMYVYTDYSATESLYDLVQIPNIPRISVLLNGGTDGAHHAVLRPPGDSAIDQPAIPILLPADAIGPVTEELRRKLARLVAGRRKPSRQQLIEDLRLLAPEGLKLHRVLFGQARDVFGSLMRQSPRPLLSVARPSHAAVMIPWQCIYQIGLPDDMRIEDVPVCPLVLQWDEQAPLVAGVISECPRTEDTDHSEPLLCPFGFYGYRQAIECVSSARDTHAELSIKPDATMAIGLTEEGVDSRALKAHLDELKALLAGAFPGLTMNVKSSYQDMKQLLSNDLPLVYFFCHGQRSRRSGDISLGIGKEDTLSAGDFEDWVATSYTKPPIIWSKIRPLVFINACQSLEIKPSTLVSYADAFIGAAGAMGVIGTEIKVPEDRAARFATEFFRYFIQYSGQYLSGLISCPFERALTAARFQFLQSGDLFGLAYTADAKAHLHIQSYGTQDARRTSEVIPSL